MTAVPRSRYAVFFGIAIVGCLLDLTTKSLVFDWLQSRGGEFPLWRGFFALETTLNEGALFGLGQGKVAVFASLSIAAAIGIVYWLFALKAASDLLLTVALGGITAGILGNLYDRLGLPGLRWGFGNPLHEPGTPVYAVRDWILVMLNGWRWPNFNIADSLLVCGACLLVWHSFVRGGSTTKLT